MPIPKLVATAVLMAANMAMTALKTTEGPRLKDTKATVADYGTPCNYYVGTVLLPAHCTFAKPIEEKRKKRKGKGGKQVSYTGYGTFMVQVADQPSVGILKIYLDNHLVYDATGSGEETYPLAEDYELEASMRFMLGAEDQEPDPDMLAYIEARDGAGTCPAYRGQTNIYFERIPLERFGNRFPDVKVLVYETASEVIPAPEEEIVYVGGMTVEGNDAITENTETFALTGGVDATPETGDTVLLICVQAGQYFGAVPAPTMDAGWETLATGTATDGTGFLDYRLTVYGQRMGVVPETGWTWASEEGIIGWPTTGWMVLVFRNVWEEILDVEPVLRENYTDDDNVPDPITLSFGGSEIEPGVICDFVGSDENISITLALRSESGEQAEVIAVGLFANSGASWNAGNFTDFIEVEAHGTVGASGGVAWGPWALVVEDATLEDILTAVAVRGGLAETEYDFSQATQPIPGYSWTQGSGQQICEPMCDIHDVDMRPHNFIWEALPRTGVSAGDIPVGEFVASDDGAPYSLPDVADEDLPRKVFFSYCDLTAGYEANTAEPVGGPARGATGSAGEMSIDMTTYAERPDMAQALVERRQRRLRCARPLPEFGLTRQMIALEPGDVWTPAFDDVELICRLTKLTVGADGKLVTEWERDDPRLATLPGSSGADQAGNPEDVIPSSVDSIGEVLDIPLLADAHEQTSPLVYLVGAPESPGVWMGMSFAQSDTGELDSYLEDWDGIGSGDGAVIGTCAAELPDNALPWVPDLGSSVEVTINAGELTAATLDELIEDDTVNLAAIQSGDGWELVQFMTPTLTDAYTYTITGFLRGVRGTEWAMAGHYPGDTFVLLDGTAKRHTFGASEIGDEDFYVVSTTGQAVDQDTAFSVDYTGASHKPYAPVYGELTFDTGVTDDITIDATRRTRIGGTTLDGSDVPLGETTESWEADIYDGVTFKRTLTGTSLPLTYTAAQQTADFGAPVTTGFEVYLYQMSPPLSLRGYELAMAA